MTVWENTPSTNSPINADNLNKIEKALESLNEGLSIDINGLSNKTYSPNLKFEMGYISNGEEKSNTINARSCLIHLNVGDKINIHRTYGGAVYHIYSNGVWQELILGFYQLESAGYVTLSYPANMEVQETVIQAFDVRFVVNRPSNVEITDLAQAYQIMDVTCNYHYARLNNLETAENQIKNLLMQPNYSKSEIVAFSIAPVTYPVSLVSGHTYKAMFKSSADLNQTSFYLQIWATQSIDDPSTVLKNYGNVWSTEDTSGWLEYTFTADANYNGYFRFGYALNSIPDAVTAMEMLYDLTESEYYELYNLDARISYLETHGEDNPYTGYWRDKKIAWFGTSIPAGVVNAGESGGNGAYPTRVGNMLGATVYNEAVGSSAARIGKHGSISESDPNGYAGVPAPCCLLSLAGTVAEKTAILNNWNYWKEVFTIGVDQIDTSNPNKYYDCSYERKLAKYLSGGSVGQVDLYVFDHGYNDAGNLNGSNYSETKDIPTDLHDRTYFIGAMNFLIDLIKKDNFRASIVIVSHYNDEGAFADLIEAQSYIANKWNIPFINISDKLGFSSSMSVTIGGTTKTMKNWWLPDGIHPSSDTSGKALQHYADVLYPLIRDAR